MPLVPKILVLALIGLSFYTLPASAADDTLTLYSARKAHLIEPVLERYTAQTGVEFELLTGKAGPLLERLDAGARPGDVDILLTVDAGNLWQATERDLLIPLQSELLQNVVPPALRDPEQRWFGLSKRARTIVHHRTRVPPEDLSSYEDLADPKWQGRLCLRTSKKVYNQSLVASLITHHGVEKTEAIVRGWVANLAVDPFSNDTKTLKAVAAGQCDVAIINTYYYGRLMREQPELELALFWPNQTSQGVHVNVSGAGITRFAGNPEQAQKFLEWLVSNDAQALFAQLNLEYPVRPGVPLDPAVQAWGMFAEDTLNLAEVGRLQADSVRLMDRAGYR